MQRSNKATGITPKPLPLKKWKAAKLSPSEYHDHFINAIRADKMCREAEPMWALLDEKLRSETVEIMLAFATVFADAVVKLTRSKGRPSAEKHNRAVWMLVKQAGEYRKYPKGPTLEFWRTAAEVLADEISDLLPPARGRRPKVGGIINPGPPSPHNIAIQAAELQKKMPNISNKFAILDVLGSRGVDDKQFKNYERRFSEYKNRKPGD